MTVLHDLRLDTAILHRPQFLILAVCLEQVLPEFRFVRAKHAGLGPVEELLDDASIGIAKGEDGAASISPGLQ